MTTSQPKHHGVLVVLEGIDGSGKSSLASFLAQELASRGYDVVSTREPTSGPWGRRIRAYAEGRRGDLTPEEEFQLFHEDRKAHVHDLVSPSLARGAVVIQDRSYFSTVAYQGERGLDRDRLLKLSRSIAPEPDLLLLLDLPAEVALERIKKGRGGRTDDFEHLDALKRIRAQFLSFSEAHRLDARQAPEALAASALRLVKPLLPPAPSL